MKKYYEFYYNLSTAYFISDSDRMYMDKNTYILSAPSKAVCDDILISTDDLFKIYAPYMEISVDETGAKLEMNDITAEIKFGSNKITVNGQTKEMKNTAEKSADGKTYVPVGDVMGLAFDKYIACSNNTHIHMWSLDNFIVAVSDKYEYVNSEVTHTIEKVERTGFEFSPDVTNVIKLDLMGKEYGEKYLTYWYEKAQKLMTYSAFVPTGYDPENPSKLIVQLHGGGLGEQAIYSLSKNMVQFYCEKYNYLYIAPNACTKNSAYGNIFFAGPMTNAELVDPDSDNPFNLSEEEIKMRKLGEYGILAAIDAISAEYNVDKEHIYLMGNSMGGLGTYHLASAYPELFRAISPFGAGLDEKMALRYNLKDKPIRMVGGTEDGGFARIKATYDLFKANGYNVELAVVGGGVHFDAWAYVLDDTFKFFDKNA